VNPHVMRKTREWNGSVLRVWRKTRRIRR